MVMQLQRPTSLTLQYVYLNQAKRQESASLRSKIQKVSSVALSSCSCLMHASRADWSGLKYTFKMHLCEFCEFYYFSLIVLITLFDMLRNAVFIITNYGAEKYQNFEFFRKLNWIVWTFSLGRYRLNLPLLAKDSQYLHESLGCR